MIVYHAPYSSKLGTAPRLGQDAVIVPVLPVKGPLPDLLPQGPQPVEPAAPAPAPAPQGPATITIGGKKVTVASVVIATAITVGAFAVVGAAISSYNRKR